MYTSNMWQRFTEKILLSSFEPIETLLVVHKIVSGIILLLPDNTNLFILTSPPDFKIALGIIMVLMGVLHFLSLTVKGWPNKYKIRRTGTLMGFLSWLYITFTKLIHHGPILRFDWASTLVIAMIFAMLHLSLSYKRLTRE